MGFVILEFPYWQLSLGLEVSSTQAMPIPSYLYTEVENTVKSRRSRVRFPDLES